MLTLHFQCLLALHRSASFEQAARACGLDPQAFLSTLEDAERVYGRALVHRAEAFGGFTPLGEVVLACARKLAEAPAAARTATPDAAAGQRVASLLERRSVSPKRLGSPGPGTEQLDLILQAALCAPDHGGLHPWRVIEFRSDTRAALAALFEDEKRRRDPLASPNDLRLAREHATRPPVLLGFVFSPKPRSRVPAREQWLAAGAALGNLLNAAHQLGFGAIVLSGERCYDAMLSARLGVSADEALVGFVSIGRVVQVPPERRAVLPGLVWSCWSPGVHAQVSQACDESMPKA